MSVLDRFKCFLLIILVTFIGVSYHPHFFSDEVNSIRTGISFYIFALTVVLTLLSLDTKILRVKIIRIYLFLVLSFVCIAIALTAIDLPVSITEIRNISIPLAAIVIGYNLKLSNRAFKILIIAFSISVLFSVYSQLKINIGGFIIAEQYLVNAKNGLGGLTSLSGISILLLLKGGEKRSAKLLIIAYVIFILIFLLTIRARSSTIAYFCVVTLFLYKSAALKKQQERTVLIYVASVLTLTFILISSIDFQNRENNPIIDYVYNSFALNKSTIDSGRSERNIDALEVISTNPLLGNLIVKAPLKSVHNYPLRVIADYGLIGSWPLIYIYFMIILYAIRKIYKMNHIRLFDAGLFLLLSQYIISIAEPSFPFGPGSVSFFAFFMFGFHLQKKMLR